jgi:hypothetical protein
MSEFTFAGDYPPSQCHSSSLRMNSQADNSSRLEADFHISAREHLHPLTRKGWRSAVFIRGELPISYPNSQL